MNDELNPRVGGQAVNGANGVNGVNSAGSVDGVAGGHYRIALTVGDHSPRHVRRIVRALLQAWALPGLVDAAELVVTELLSNVYRHVPDRRCVAVLARAEDGDGVWLAVRDCAAGSLPRVRYAAPTDESGRGLALIEAVADKWGVEPDPGGGKTVWCELRPH
jgi:anti-sigma regulatory factor (Ser/Thr protein kinase)